MRVIVSRAPDASQLFAVDLVHDTRSITITLDTLEAARDFAAELAHVTGADLGDLLKPTRGHRGKGHGPSLN